jgi:hypothetical protein
MNTTSGECFELNAVGAAVWELIGRGLELEAITDEIVRAYAVERSTASSDILRLIDDLARQGIVTVARR